VKSPQDLKRERDRARLIDALRPRVPSAAGVGCFCCKLIVEDFDLHGELTGHPKDSNGQAVFPRVGKLEHIRLENPTLDKAGP
jgi:hypothetical protein